MEVGRQVGKCKNAPAGIWEASSILQISKDIQESPTPRQKPLGNQVLLVQLLLETFIWAFNVKWEKKKAVNDSCYCKKPIIQPSPKLITVHCKTTCVSFPTILFKRLSQNVTDLTVRSLKIRKKFSISWLCCKANIALQLEDLFSPTCLPQTPLWISRASALLPLVCQG